MLKVPAGTQIFAEDGETLIADLTEVGQRIRLAKGGNGGFGNAYFTTSTNRAPKHANPGLEGQEMWIWLRLKLIADAGLVGLPNAGKSTFLASVTAAKPKIADYPFTTLHPGLGVVRSDNREFVLADIPGLIEGAHEGVGLGDRFLAHVERCRVLLHLVDGTSEHAGKSYKLVRGEIEAYGNGLADKPEIVALSKADALDAETLKSQVAQAEARRRPRAAGAVLGEPEGRARSAAGAPGRDRCQRGGRAEAGGRLGAVSDGRRGRATSGGAGARMHGPVKIPDADVRRGRDFGQPRRRARPDGCRAPV